MNDNKTKLYALLDKLGVTLRNEQKELSGKGLMKATLQSWIPAHEVGLALAFPLLLHRSPKALWFPVPFAG